MFLCYVQHQVFSPFWPLLTFTQLLTLSIAQLCFAAYDIVGNCRCTDRCTRQAVSIVVKVQCNYVSSEKLQKHVLVPLSSAIEGGHTNRVCILSLAQYMNT